MYTKGRQLFSKFQNHRSIRKIVGIGVLGHAAFKSGVHFILRANGSPFMDQFLT